MLPHSTRHSSDTICNCSGVFLQVMKTRLSFLSKSMRLSLQYMSPFGWFIHIFLRLTGNYASLKVDCPALDLSLTA